MFLGTRRQAIEDKNHSQALTFLIWPIVLGAFLFTQSASLSYAS